MIGAPRSPLPVNAGRLVRASTRVQVRFARMRKSSIMLDATATIARRDQVRDIDAEDLASLRSKMPDGAALIAVRVG